MGRWCFLEGRLFYQNNEINKAIDSYKKALKYDPYRSGYYYTLGKVYIKEEQFFKAIFMLKKNLISYVRYFIKLKYRG